MYSFQTFTTLVLVLLPHLTRQGRFTSDMVTRRECDGFDVVFELESPSAIMCAAVCNTYQMCLGIYYNQSSQWCTGCSGFYTDDISTGGDVIQHDTKYYYNCANNFGWSTFEETSYKLVFTFLYYTEAKTFCHALCGSLVHTDTITEMQYLRTIASSADAYGVYIGLEYNVSTGEWIWGDDGTLVNLTNWHIGEPNLPETEHCVAILKYTNYEWADVTCFSTTHFFACEKELRI